MRSARRPTRDRARRNLGRRGNLQQYGLARASDLDAALLEAPLHAAVDAFLKI
jgi:hypothetical protein